MKRFTLGFIIGGIICSALTGFAVEYAVTANPFPIRVDGAEKSIEGYNINDSTYFKLRDVADAVGGFTVGFTNNTITISTSQEPSEPINTDGAITIYEGQTRDNRMFDAVTVSFAGTDVFSILRAIYQRSSRFCNSY